MCVSDPRSVPRPANESQQLSRRRPSDEFASMPPVGIGDVERALRQVRESIRLGGPRGVHRPDDVTQAARRPGRYRYAPQLTVMLCVYEEECGTISLDVCNLKFCLVPGQSDLA